MYESLTLIIQSTMRNPKISILSKLFVMLSLFVVPFFAGSELLAQDTHDLHIKVTNVAPGKGKIVVSVFNTKATWLKAGKEFKIVKQPVDKSTTLTVTVPGLKAGKYAIIIYQDENNNGEFDRNFLNIPKEPYALSNNIKPMFKPSFDDSLFNFNKEMTLNLKLLD